jgi:hypothetical protein
MTRRLWAAIATVLATLWLLDFIAWPLRARGVAAWTIAAIKLSLFAWLGSVALRSGRRLTAPLIAVVPGVIEVVVQHHIGPATVLGLLLFTIAAAVLFGALGALFADQQRKRAGFGAQAI